MLIVLLANVPNSKIFDDKREGDVISGVFIDRRIACHWGVAEFGKVEFESVVGDFSGLFQVKHFYQNLHLHPPISGKCAKVVLGNIF